MPGKEIKGRSKIANYRHGGRTGLKEGMGAAKKRKKSPGPLGRDKSKFTGPPSQSSPKPKPKKEAPREGGRRPGPSKGTSPEQLRKQPKVEEDWAAKGGRIGFKKGTNKNGPVRPIDLPEDPWGPEEKKKKRK